MHELVHLLSYIIYVLRGPHYMPDIFMKYLSRVCCWCATTNLEGIFLLPVDYIQYKSSQYVEALTIPHLLIPSGIRQQHPLEGGSVFLIVLAIKTTTSRPVQIL